METSDHHYDPPWCPTAASITCRSNATSANPPCVKVRPVEATWQEPDGITVIDYDWCIGCRFARRPALLGSRFNFAEPEIAPDQVNPDMAYLSNRPREGGDGEMHLLPASDAVGRMPACLEVRPTGRASSATCSIRRASGVYPAAQAGIRVQGGRGDDSAVLLLLDERGSRHSEPIARPARRKRMKKYATFLWDCFRLSFVGDWRYHLWMTILTLASLAG